VFGDAKMTTALFHLEAPLAPERNANATDNHSRISGKRAMWVISDRRHIYPLRSSQFIPKIGSIMQFDAR